MEIYFLFCICVPFYFAYQTGLNLNNKAFYSCPIEILLKDNKAKVALETPLTFTLSYFMFY